jgi:hypothetical protein
MSSLDYFLFEPFPLGCGRNSKAECGSSDWRSLELVETAASDEARSHSRRSFGNVSAG